MNRLLIAIAVSSLAIGNAFAQAGFQTIDTDNSGGISLEEANAAGLAWTKSEFDAADKDASGALDEAEFAAAIQ